MIRCLVLRKVTWRDEQDYHRLHAGETAEVPEEIFARDRESFQVLLDPEDDPLEVGAAPDMSIDYDRVEAALLKLDDGPVPHQTTQLNVEDAARRGPGRPKKVKPVPPETQA